MPKDKSSPKTEPHIPRPPNRWILYRADKVKEIEPPLGQPRRQQSEISKIIAGMWAREPFDIKQVYEQKAAEAKADHARKHPKYQYMPQTKEVKKQKQKLRREELARERAAAKQSQVRPAPYTTTPHRHLHTEISPAAVDERYATYGPSGPSPPLSAASTPERVHSPPARSPTSRASPVASTSQLPSLRIPESAFSAPASVPPPSVRTPISKPPSAQGSSATAASRFASAWQSPLSQASSEETRVGEDQDAAPTQPQSLSIPESSQDMGFAQFSFPSQGSPNVRGWSDGGVETMLNDATFDPNNFASLLSSTSDPMLFNMNSFDASVLISGPLGQIDASVGALPPMESTATFYPNTEDLFSNYAWPVFENQPVEGSSQDYSAVFNGTVGQSFDYDSPPSATAETPSYDFCPQSGHPIFPPPLEHGESHLDPMLFQYLNIDGDPDSSFGSSGSCSPQGLSGLHSRGMVVETTGERFLAAMDALNAGHPLPLPLIQPVQPTAAARTLPNADARPAPAAHMHSVAAVQLVAPQAIHAQAHATFAVPQMQAEVRRTGSSGDYAGAQAQQDVHGSAPASAAPASNAGAYVPPAGAGRAASRRVAASWKTAFALQDVPMEAPGQPPVQWGVRVPGS